ncbi:D-aminoacyl-tRNA deacylase [Laribacter hongkongensis]|uniref:D-aminoacyl-tRNA deacylase n=1 Tax=Laribacter hongkongensis TaxID=168471 RepID=UPI0004802C37|nr:D-aminoacyl-tRNA deacylase [Laribacter hongkongensis]MCG8994040.1 D-tyrosyl-tRNA(Tyr) deacylase [Laribacter hongkongensis]MCG9009599.1 D-tyrosyl-tRNA(Tyr) deacylase [Laribacter hongkongensis]MCG9022517.1 D-tyrosyl-tRNA(Tyr) deacylase [Laribacter hongkongensis]MCG9031178.1 D-tyrosyl-tRNA(Tyr) deacylase [Laribacter hongkongensis]MCG9046698.1 D-tyrosyl-tRNA(Tyr) deacylase [Laribacter hongkongensis]
MRVLLQRVGQASVEVDRQVVGEIGRGLLLLVGVEPEDGAADIDWLVRKIVNLRVFSDAEGRMNRSVLEDGGEVLAVSQFTLFASCRKGNRPSWSRAAPPELARCRFDQFVAAMSEALQRPVPTGVFGADMQVALVNDGPVTLWLDSRQPE